MKKIYSYILSIFAFLSLFCVFSCSEIAETSELEQNTPTNTYSIVYDPTLNGRGLINLKLANNTSSRFATTKIEVDSYRFKINGTPYDPTKISSPTETVYAFTLDPGTYTFVAEVLDPSSNVVASGSKSIVVMANGCITDTITIEAGDISVTTGNVNLEISCSVSDITRLQVVGLTQQAKIYSKAPNNKFTITEADITVGLHTVTLNFMNGNNTVITSIQEGINVIAGLTTNSWKKTGSEEWLPGETFTITDAILRQIANKEVFVKEGSTGLKNGTWASPYATLQDAINKVQTINDGSTQYTIFVDGTLNNAYGEIAPSSNLKLKITSRTTNKATLNGSSAKSQILKIQSRANVTLDNLILDGQSRSSASIQGIQTYLNSTLTVKDCDIRYCSTTNNGSGINNIGTLTIENSKIINCVSTNNGGGINTTGTSFNFKSGIITGCKASLGGGIYINGGSVTLGSNTGDAVIGINGTYTTPNTAENGGGIYINDVTSISLTSNCYIGNSTLSTNSVSGAYGNKAENGGGIYTKKEITIYGSKIIGNQATTTSTTGDACGGGVYVDTGGSFNIINFGYISYCSAKNGGGIYSKGTVNITVGTIGSTSTGSNYSNKATENGGGFYIDASGSLTLSGSTIGSCSAGQNGGGIYSQGEVFMSGTTIGSDSTGSNFSNRAVSGGGIYFEGSKKLTIMNHATIKSCYASNGGGIYYNSSATDSKISDTTIKNCTGSLIGGGIYSKLGKLTLTSNSIEYCKSTDGANQGGGIYIADTGTVEMSSGIIKNCSAYLGGGIDNRGTFKMSGGNISNCTNTNSGTSVGMGKAIRHDGTLFELKGSAKIDSNNDVYLNNNKTIKITGNLTNTEVATITPSLYSEGRQILTNDGVILSEQVSKFTLPDEEFYINSLGKISKTTIALTSDDDLQAVINSITETNKEITLDLTNYTAGPPISILNINSKKIKLTSTINKEISYASSFLGSISATGSITLGDNLTLNPAGTPKINCETGVVIIDGATIKATSYQSCVEVTGGTFVMKKGTITSTTGNKVASTGILVKGGTVNITGGTIENFGDSYQLKYPLSLEGGSGTIKNLEVKSCTNNINITGGTWAIEDCRIQSNTVSPSRSGRQDSRGTRYGMLAIFSPATITSFKNNNISSNIIDSSGSSISYIDAFGCGMYIEGVSVPNNGGNTITGNNALLGAASNYNTCTGKQIYCKSGGSYGGSSASVD